MSNDLSNLLDLPTKLSAIKLIAITADDLNNCSFAFHSLLQSSARELGKREPEEGTRAPRLFLLLLSQSYSHFATVSAKAVGLNLKNLREKGSLLVVDLLDHFEEFCLQSKEGQFDFKKLTRLVFQQIATSFEPNQPESGSASTSSTASCLFIDDLSCLLSLGVPVNQIYNFIRVLRSVCLKAGCSLVIQSFLDKEREDEEVDQDLNQLVNSVVYCSDLWLQLNSLETGFSQKVDGVLDIHDFNCILSVEKERRLHFKTSQRSAKLFAPGSD